MTEILRDIDACVFDAYGTLFNHASAVMRCRKALGDQVEVVAALWRAKQLEYTWLRSLMGRYADFWQVTGESLDYALTAIGKTDPQLRAALMQQYFSPEPYEDGRTVLKKLHDAGMRTAILSNGTPTMLAAALNSSGLAPLIGQTLSADAVKTFKPHGSVYQLATDRLGIAANRLCFVSANGWDIAGAGAAGMRPVWVNRTGAQRDYLPALPEAVIADLNGLPPLLGL